MSFACKYTGHLWYQSGTGVHCYHCLKPRERSLWLLWISLAAFVFWCIR